MAAVTDTEKKVLQAISVGAKQADSDLMPHMDAAQRAQSLGVELTDFGKAVDCLHEKRLIQTHGSTPADFLIGLSAAGQATPDNQG